MTFPDGYMGWQPYTVEDTEAEDAESLRERQDSPDMLLVREAFR